MNKIKICLIDILLLFVLFPATLFSSCLTSDNLKKINLSYELDEEFYYNVVLSNLPNDVFVKVVNKTFNETETYYADKIHDGKLFIYNSDIYIPQKLEIEIYNNSSTCGTEILKKLSYDTPTYNIYSNLSICKNSSSELCGKFYDTSDISLEEASDKINEYNKEHKEIIDFQKVPNILGGNLIFFVLPFFITTIIVIIILIFSYRKKVKKDEE